MGLKLYILDMSKRSLAESVEVLYEGSLCHRSILWFALIQLLVRKRCLSMEAVSIDQLWSSVNQQLTRIKVTRSIVGLRKEESDALLNFLVTHIGRGIDYQARVRWAPRTVVVWDVSWTLLLGLSKNSTDVFK
jgi:hypothetical protein